MNQIIFKIRLLVSNFDSGKLSIQIARWTIVSVLFLTALALYFPALGTEKFVYGTDTVAHDYILHQYTWNSATQEYKQIPLWNPFMFSGTPMLGSAAICPFYPSQWLYIFLPFNTAFTLQYVFALFVGGIGTVYWMRTLGIRLSLSFWAGLLYMFSGHFLTLTYAGHLQKMIALAWTPVALGATASIVTGGTLRLKNAKLIRSGILLGVALGMQLLATHPQIFYGTAAVCFLHLFGVAFASIPWRQLAPGADGILLSDLVKKIRPAIIAFLISLGAILTCLSVSAVQFFPIMETNAVSNRAQGVKYEEAVNTSYPPAELLEYGISRVFGDSVVQTKTPYTGKWGERVVSDYVGIPVLFLAVIGFIATRRRYRWFLLTMVISGILLGLGSNLPFYKIAYTILPGFKSFRSPGTFMFLTNCGIIALATLGFDAIISYGLKLQKTNWKSGLQPASVLQKHETPAEETLSNSYDDDSDEVDDRPRTSAPHLYKASTTEKKIPLITETAESKPMLEKGGFLLLLVLCSIGLAVVSIIAYGKNWDFRLDIATKEELRNHHLYAAIGSTTLALALMVFSIFLLKVRLVYGMILLGATALILPLVNNIHFLYFDSLRPYQSHLLTQPTLKALAKKAPQPIRLVDSNLLSINQMLHEVGTVLGYHPVTLNLYDTLAANLNPTSDAFAALFGVNYARTVKQDTIEGNWEKDSEYRRFSSTEYLWRRKNPTPYTHNQAIVHAVNGDNDLVTSVAVTEIPKMVKADLTPSSPHDAQPYNHAFVSEKLLKRNRVLPGDQHAKLNLQRWNPHKIMLYSSADTVDPARRYLVPLSEPFAEGWKAVTAEGKNVPVIPINGGQRALVVPPGETTIRMRYEPFGFKLGLFVTLSTLAFLATAGTESLTRRGNKSRKKLRKFLRKLQGNPSETGAMPSINQTEKKP